MTAERLDSFVPVETVPLPRPLHRFGTAFPLGLAEAYVNAYTDERAAILDRHRLIPLPDEPGEGRRLD